MCGSVTKHHMGKPEGDVSVRMRRSTRNSFRVTAAKNDMTIKDLMDVLSDVKIDVKRKAIAGSFDHRED